MIKKRSVLYCEKCKTVLEVLSCFKESDCCNKNMKVLVEKNKEVSSEKHVPIITKIKEGYKVVIGNKLHPMDEDHYIQWIELLEKDFSQIKFLKPGDDPIAIFKTDSKNIHVRSYCNIHGLWKS